MDIQEFTTVAEIVREIRKPGKVYVGMLIANDVAYVVAEKGDLIEWLQGRSDPTDPGVVGSRSIPSGLLHIDNTP